MNWNTKSFDELSNRELYDILALRAEVFVVEQDCAYQDVDGKDELGKHLMCYKNNSLVAYARLLPKSVSYNDACSIGRVLTKKKVRMHGIGIELMERAIIDIKQSFACSSVHISAQCYLTAFYQKFGFEESGESYLEDGIPHIKMILDLTKKNPSARGKR